MPAFVPSQLSTIRGLRCACEA